MKNKFLNIAVYCQELTTILVACTLFSIQRKITVESVLYFGWTNQPSSGTVRICIGSGTYIKSICAKTELLKAKVIDSIKDEASVIIKNKKRKKVSKFLLEY